MFKDVSVLIHTNPAPERTLLARLTRILLKASDSREACPPSRTMSDKVPLSLRHICFSYSDNQKLNFSSAADARASQVQSKVHV